MTKPVAIATGVLMLTAPNAGVKTLQGTNCYIVGQREKLVIDAGPDLPPFQEKLARLTGDAVAILLTHDHPDHAGGARYLSRLLGVPVWVGGKSHTIADRSWHAIEHGQGWSASGAVVTSVEAPGHSWDSTCFITWPEGILFSGDVILGEGTTLIALPEGDVGVYMETLEILRQLKPSMIAPGHGRAINDPQRKIAEYVDHRRSREQQLLDRLTIPKTVTDLVADIYSPNSSDVRDLASLSVEAQLAKLLDEGRVQRVNGDRYQLSASS